MKISKRRAVVRLLAIMLGLGMLAFLVVSCKTTPPADGTITVELTNAASQDTKFFVFGVYKEGANYATDPYDGYGIAEIDGTGVAQDTAVDPASPPDLMSFDGGERYFIYAFVLVDPNQDPTSGDFIYVGSPFTVDGNMTLTLDFAGFTEIL